METSLTAFTPQHRRWTRIAMVFAFMTVVGLCVALFFATRYGGSWDKGSVGFFLVTLVAFVGGNYFLFQVVDSVAHKANRVIRRGGFAALVLSCLGVWGLVAALVVSSQVQWSFRSRASADELEAVLGSGPDEVSVFVPFLPHSPHPPLERIEELEPKLIYFNDHDGGWRDASEHYEQDGVHVFFDLVGDAGDASYWGPPSIEVEGAIDLPELTQLWGPPVDDSFQPTWRRNGFEATLRQGSSDKGATRFLDVRRVRPVSEVIGPSIEQPLADFEGRLIGKHIDELDAPVQRGWDDGEESYHYTTWLHAENSTIDLDLGTDKGGTIVGWRVLLHCSHDDGECDRVEARLAANMGASETLPKRRPRDESKRFRSTLRPELEWETGEYMPSMKAGRTN